MFRYKSSWMEIGIATYTSHDLNDNTRLAEWKKQTAYCNFQAANDFWDELTNQRARHVKTGFESSITVISLRMWKTFNCTCQQISKQCLAIVMLRQPGETYCRGISFSERSIPGVQHNKPAAAVMKHIPIMPAQLLETKKKSLLTVT